MSEQKLNIVEVDLGPVSKECGPAEATRVESGPASSWDHLVDGVNYSLRSQRAQAEIFAINRALDRAGWNRKRAAQLLRISYRALLYKISHHKITRTGVKPGSTGAGAGTLAHDGIK
jgi:DNA-binding NtrC family response regulator